METLSFFAKVNLMLVIKIQQKRYRREREIAPKKTHNLSTYAPENR